MKMPSYARNKQIRIFKVLFSLERSSFHDPDNDKPIEQHRLDKETPHCLVTTTQTTIDISPSDISFFVGP